MTQTGPLKSGSFLFSGVFTFYHLHGISYSTGKNNDMKSKKASDDAGCWESPVSTVHRFSIGFVVRAMSIPYLTGNPFLLKIKPTESIEQQVVSIPYLTGHPFLRNFPERR